MSILQEAEVTNGYVYLKFNSTIKLTTIVQDIFTVATDVATPVEISDPFQDFTVKDNYNTVARSLKVYWNTGKLSPSTDYTITVSGLEDAASRDIDSFELNFTTGASVDPDETETPPPTLETIEIEDFSVITDIDFSATDEVSSIDPLEVSSSDLADGAFYFDNDYNNGRVAILFSQRPNIETVTTAYIKAYRKLIQRKPIRWESVDIEVSLDSSNPIVYVDFPSTDDTPVYFTAGSDYFEDGYKYKIVISRGVST